MPILRTPRQPFDDAMDPRGRGSFQVPQGPPESPLDQFAPTDDDIPPNNVPIPGGDGARGGESGRERGSNITNSTPKKPIEPTPMAGSMGPSINPPMAGVSPEALTSVLRGRGNFGGLGGLTEGGFGMPFDPTSNQKSDPIEGLLSTLRKPKGLF